jgi:hypothetical protein
MIVKFLLPQQSFGRFCVLSGRNLLEISYEQQKIAIRVETLNQGMKMVRQYAIGAHAKSVFLRGPFQRRN